MDRFDVNEAIRNAIILTRGEVVKIGGSIQTQLAEPLPFFRGDRVQIQQVMVNLIVNAVQPMSGDGHSRRELQISTETDGADGVRVGVRDTGPGLAPESLPRLLARERGAAQVVGPDLSDRMLAQARANTSDTLITFDRADLEQLGLPEACFDLVYSSLAVHYIDGAGRLFETIYRALIPRGSFIFSTEHPIYMAPANPNWSTDAAGRKIWPLNDYFMEGPRTTDWISKGVVKHHRTLGTTLNLLVRSGFTIRHVEEFCPTTDQIAAKPELAEERERPMFVLIAAQR